MAKGVYRMFWGSLLMMGDEDRLKEASGCLASKLASSTFLKFEAALILVGKLCSCAWGS